MSLVYNILVLFVFFHLLDSLWYSAPEALSPMVLVLGLIAVLLAMMGLEVKTGEGNLSIQTSFDLACMFV